MSTIKPLVSIGLPTYNRAASLKRAVESALAQDFPNLELVISDNASTDETKSMCEEFCRQDSRVRYIVQPVNQGIMANFQTVLDESRGEFFMWLADDDWLDPDYVRECLAVLAKQPDCQLVCGRARYYENDNFRFEEDSINLIGEDRYGRVLAYFRQVTTNGTFYGLVRGHAVAGLKVQNKVGGDWLVMANLAFLGKIRTLESVHVNRSLGGVSQQGARTLLSVYGLPALFAKSPFSIVAFNVFREVAWKSPVYKPLGRRKRISLGAKSALSIIKRYRAIIWLEKLLELPQTIRQTINSLRSKLIIRTRVNRAVRKALGKRLQAK
jgi:glycosyltransferase involved in cell wall biosynthesis